MRLKLADKIIVFQEKQPSKLDCPFMSKQKKITMTLSRSTEKGLEKHTFAAGGVLKMAANNFCTFKGASYSGIQGTGCGALVH